MYKPITSVENTDDFSTCFDRDCNRRKPELTINKNIKKYLVRIMLMIVFGCAEHQEKATHGLGCISTKSSNSDSSVLNKANETDNAKIKNCGFEWYVTQYTPSIPQQAIISKRILTETPTELQNIERVF